MNELQDSPLAIHTDDANAQHYELPADFFKLCLGGRLKYSGCYYAPAAKPWTRPKPPCWN